MPQWWLARNRIEVSTTVDAQLLASGRTVRAAHLLSQRCGGFGGVGGLFTNAVGFGGAPFFGTCPPG